MPRWTSGQAEGLDHEVEPGRLRGPDQPGDHDQARQRPQPHGREDALLEPIVELDDPVRDGQRGDDPPAEVAHREKPDREEDDEDDPGREDDLDLGRQPGPERDEAGREPQDDDREEVEDPLDEDGPERPRQRDRAVDLQQVRPVDVAELRRHQAVHQPGQEDDLRAVADPEREPGPPDQERPAQAPEREAGIEDPEGEEQDQPVRARGSCPAARPGGSRAGSGRTRPAGSAAGRAR